MDVLNPNRCSKCGVIDAAGCEQSSCPARPEPAVSRSISYFFTSGHTDAIPRTSEDRRFTVVVALKTPDGLHTEHVPACCCGSANLRLLFDGRGSEIAGKAAASRYYVICFDCEARGAVKTTASDAAAAWRHYADTTNNDQRQGGEKAQWADCERIADLPAIHEALENFTHDPTGDNGTCVVRAVLDSVHSITIPTATSVAGGVVMDEKMEGIDLDKLEDLARRVPEHIQLKGWYVNSPSFGNQHVYADDFKGQGRQHIATIPAGKRYFGSLAEFIAAANPATVLRLIAAYHSAAGAKRAVPEWWNQAAEFIEKKARNYINEQADTDLDTGDVVWHYGKAGRDYHGSLVELAEELRAAAPSPQQAELRGVGALVTSIACASGQVQIKFIDQEVPEWSDIGCMVELFAAAPSPAAAKEGGRAHGHRGDYYLLANARRILSYPRSSILKMQNWTLAMELFATGSNSAYQICIDAGIDPDSCKVERQRSTQQDSAQVAGKDGA